MSNGLVTALETMNDVPPSIIVMSNEAAGSHREQGYVGCATVSANGM